MLRVRVTPGTWQNFYDAYAEWRKGRTSWEYEEFLQTLLSPYTNPPGPRRSVMSALGAGTPPSKDR